MNSLIHSFLLVITLNYWNRLRIFCKGDTIYGIVICKQPRHPTRYSVYGVHYNITIKNPKLTLKDKLEMISFSYNHHDISRILEEFMKRPQFKGIPNDQIFIKLFYSIDYVTSLSEDELIKTMDNDHKLMTKYMRIHGVLNIETYRWKWWDLLTFGIVNINIETEELTPNVVMLFRNDQLFLGFIVSEPQQLPQKLISNVKYSSKDYSVVTNTFSCAAPMKVNYLIYIKLIRESDGSKEILHPCIPENSFVKLESIEHASQCFKNFKLNEPIKFIGSFNKKNCENLIHSIITDEKLNGLKFEHANFANMVIPLPIDSTKNNLMLYTSYIKQGDLGGNVENSLHNIERKVCEITTTGKETKIQVTDNDCFLIVYLAYVLENVLDYSSGNNVIIDNKMQPYMLFDKLMLVDPRIGFLLYDEQSTSTIPFEITVDTKSTTTTATTDTQIETSFMDDEITTLRATNWLAISKKIWVGILIAWAILVVFITTFILVKIKCSRSLERYL